MVLEFSYATKKTKKKKRRKGRGCDITCCLSGNSLGRSWAWERRKKKMLGRPNEKRRKIGKRRREGWTLVLNEPLD